MASVGRDPADNTTDLIPESSLGIDYGASLMSSDVKLKGLRLGFMKNFVDYVESDETTPVVSAMQSMIQRLTAAGVDIIPIEESIYNINNILATLDTQRYEYRESMAAYLQTLPSNQNNTPRSLHDIYSSSSSKKKKNNFLVIPSQYEYVSTSLRSSTSDESYSTRKQGIRSLRLALQTTLATNDLDALIYPQQRNLVVKIGSASQSGRNGILAALTGFPVVTVPAGFSDATSDAPSGVPIGMEILGRPWSEVELLGVAREIERLTRVRRPPAWAQEFLEVREYEGVPDVRPSRENIHDAYPIGVF